MFYKLKLKLFLVFLCFFLQLPFAFAADYTLQHLVITQPWSRATPKSAKVAAGYMTIINNGETADRILAVETPLSTKAQLHSMEVVDGVMKMRHQPDGIEIKPLSKIELKPRGYHIMFTNLQNGLVEGETFTAKLIFEKSGSIDVVFKIAPMGARSLEQE